MVIITLLSRFFTNSSARLFNLKRITKNRRPAFDLIDQLIEEANQEMVSKSSKQNAHLLDSYIKSCYYGEDDIL